MLKHSLLVLLVIQAIWATAQTIVINEIMSSNTTILDEDDDSPDWIELYNTGSSIVSLEGFSLSDTLLETSYWTFENAKIGPNGFLLIYASDKDRKSLPISWETIIDLGDSWNYLVPTSEPPSDWKSIEFDDSSWSSGASGFGYSDGDDNTDLGRINSIYLRKTFNIENLVDIESVLLHMDYDDGFVAYINGVEIAKSNLTSTAYNAFASPDHEAVIYSGGIPEEFGIENVASILQEGTNVVCIQVHNVSTSSSDLSAIPFLTIGTQVPTGGRPSNYLRIPSSSLHTDFKISSKGETVFLINTLGEVVDSLATGKLRSDISIGREPDGGPDFVYFQEPTPGSSNNTEGFTSFSEAVNFSQQGGYYGQAIQLTLNTESNSSNIYYSIDGSHPNNSGQHYTGPIIIDHTMVVRAIVKEENTLPSSATTNTFFVHQNHKLPIISISTDPHNLWDEDEGIYVMGPNAEPNVPHWNANFWQEWERPINIEMYEPDGSQAFNMPAGTKIFGGWSRALPQKSLSVFARGGYGDSEINYQIFPDNELDKFSSLVLRNSGNDWNNTMLRDGVITSLFHPDVDRQAFRPAVIYLNGEYWGIQNIREKVNEDFLANHHGLNPDNIIMLQNDAEVVEGDNTDYLNMLSFIQQNDLSLQENYEQIKLKMDVFNYTQYLVGNIYADNTDWPGNNIKYWKENRVGAKWRWISYDTDFGFGIWGSFNYLNNTLEFALANDNGIYWPNPPWSTFLFRNLVKNEEFRHLFINSFADQLNSSFLSENVIEKIDRAVHEIEDEIDDHMNRWDGWIGGWYGNIEGMKTFAANRSPYVRQHLMQQFNLEAEHILQVDINEPLYGSVQVNSLLIEKPAWQGNYYAGIPITITARSTQGHSFVRWEGDIASTNERIILDLFSPTSIRAVFDPSPENNRVIINEINYNSSDESNAGDWLELYNFSNIPLDLSGWVVKDGSDENGFNIQSGTVLNPGNFLVIVRDLNKYQDIHNDVSKVLGEMSFGFSSNGECISLFNNIDQLIDQVCYDTVPPWPIEANGLGYSLSLIHPSYDNEIGSNWYAHEIGTPGKRNESEFSPKLSVNNNPLQQMVCYPNPARDNISVEFTIGNQEKVDVNVYSLAGELVHQLWSGKAKKGRHLLNWEFDIVLLPGVYIISLESSKVVSSRRVVITD